MSSNDPRHWALVKRASQVAELNKLALELGMNDNTYRDALIGAGLGGAAGIGANVFANPKDDEDDEGRSMWGDVGAGMLAGGAAGLGVNQYTGGEYGGAPAAPYEALAPNSPLQQGPASPAPGPLDVDAITNELIGGGGSSPTEFDPLPIPMRPGANEGSTVQLEPIGDGDGSDALAPTPLPKPQYRVAANGFIERPIVNADGTFDGKYEDSGSRMNPDYDENLPYDATSNPSILSEKELVRRQFDQMMQESQEDVSLASTNDQRRIIDAAQAVEAQQRYDGRNRTADDPAPATGPGIGGGIAPDLAAIPQGSYDPVSGQAGTAGQAAAVAPSPVSPIAIPGAGRRIRELLGVLETTPNDKDALAELKATPSIQRLAEQMQTLRATADQPGGEDRLKRAEAMWAEATGGHLGPGGSQLATKEGAVASMARTNWAPEESHEEARHKALEFGALMAKRAMGYKESGSYAKKKKKKGNRRKVLIDPDGKAKHRPYEDDDEEKKAHLQSIISQGTARFLGREEKQAKRNEGPGQGYAPAPQGGRGMMLTRGMERKLNNPNKSIDTARVTKRLHKGKNKMSPTPRRLREDMPVGQGSTPNPFK
jgi:hypothetical protein